MWDLNTIIRENNRVAVQAMQREPEVEVAQAPRPEAWALSALAHKMRIGPPLLDELLKCFTDLEDIQSFVSMVKTYLPEHETEILGEHRSGRIYKFCYLFGKRYFPLPRFAHEVSLSGFVSALPLEMMGMSYSAYHDLEFRPGYILLLSLCVYPFEGDERDMLDDDVPFNPFDPMKRFNMENKFEQIAHGKEIKDDYKPTKADINWVKSLMLQLSDGGRWIAPMGFTFIKVDAHNVELVQAEDTDEVRETVRRTVLIAEKAGYQVTAHVGKTAAEKKKKTLLEIFTGGRVPVVDAVNQLVGEGLARRLPAEGWEAKTLHKMTDGTPYEGVGHFADWVESSTGCIVLDTNYDDCEYQEGSGEPLFLWTQFNVETLAKEWPTAQEYRWKIGHIVEWLEADLPAHFAELLDFIYSLPLHKRRVAEPNKKRGFYDPTEHWCPLDQAAAFEEDLENGEEEDGDEDGRVRIQVREIGGGEFVDGLD